MTINDGKLPAPLDEIDSTDEDMNDIVDAGEEVAEETAVNALARAGESLEEGEGAGDEPTVNEMTAVTVIRKPDSPLEDVFDGKTKVALRPVERKVTHLPPPLPEDEVEATFQGRPPEDHLSHVSKNSAKHPNEKRHGAEETNWEITHSEITDIEHPKKRSSTTDGASKSDKRAHAPWANMRWGWPQLSASRLGWVLSLGLLAWTFLRPAVSKHKPMSKRAARSVAVQPEVIPPPPKQNWLTTNDLGNAIDRAFEQTQREIQ